MNRVRVAVAVALVVGLGALALLVFVARSPFGPGDGDGSARRPNVILVCMDTLRADTLTAYGGTGRTPALDRFAATATTFFDACSSSAWTAPSVTTLLTGLLPSRHGVQASSAAEPSGGGGPPPLTGSRTLAEAFLRAGYATAAMTAGAWVAPERGLARGFDMFSVDFDVLGPEALVSGWESRRPHDRPFFLFLHTYAAHGPYGRKPLAHPMPAAEADALGAWAERVFSPAAEAKAPSDDDMRRLTLAFVGDVAAHKALVDRLRPETMSRVSTLLKDWTDGGYTRAPWRSEIEASLRTAYLDGVTAADDLFARTMRVVDGLTRAEDAVVVVVGDHGEAFGEHDLLGHGRQLSEELVRVPLLVRAPGRLAPGVVRGSCGILDALPTAMDLAGIEPFAGIDGRSLAPMARGSGAGRPVLGEERRDRLVERDVETLNLTSVRTERAKYVRTTDLKGHLVDEGIYDLRADAAEKVRLPVADLARFGDAFAAAVEKIRSAPPAGPK